MPENTSHALRFEFCDVLWGGAFLTALSLSGAGCNPFASIIWPRYLTEDSHLSLHRQSPACCSRDNTSFKLDRCSSCDAPVIRMSLK